MNDGYLPFPDSSGLVGDDDALRSRMEADGFLYLPGLLPPDATGGVRAVMLAPCRAAGWADAEGKPTGPPRLEGSPEWWEVYDPIQKSEAFHALAHHPALLGAIERLIGATVLVHPRNIGRITFPGAVHFTTPAHQDFPLIQGTPDTYTAWMPLSDCPTELGGLAILSGSHRFGMLPMRPARGPGGLECDTSVIEREHGLTWHVADMREGDVLVFHSHTVHRALPNVSQGRLRLSADYRFQSAAEPVTEDSLEPHYGRLTWEEIYADWTRDDLKYYWQRLSAPPLRVQARDGSLQTPTLAPRETAATAS